MITKGENMSILDYLIDSEIDEDCIDYIYDGEIDSYYEE